MVMETFIRGNNVKLYLLLSKTKTLKEASSGSGVTYTHVRRLVKKWVNGGLLEKHGTLHGLKYIYTAYGLEMYMVLEDFDRSMSEMGGMNG